MALPRLAPLKFGRRWSLYSGQMTAATKPAEVLVYRTPFCPYCVLAERLLKAKGAAVREIDVSNDPAARSWLLEATNQRTVPQIFINGVSVGGYDDIAALDRRGALDRLLGEQPPTREPTL
jgi:glutaredoxin 3